MLIWCILNLNLININTSDVTAGVEGGGRNVTEMDAWNMYIN